MTTRTASAVGIGPLADEPQEQRTQPMTPTSSETHPEPQGGVREANNQQADSLSVREALDRLRLLRDHARNGTPVSDPNEWEADELDAILAALSATPTPEGGEAHDDQCCCSICIVAADIRERCND